MKSKINSNKIIEKNPEWRIAVKNDCKPGSVFNAESLKNRITERKNNKNIH